MFRLFCNPRDVVEEEIAAQEEIYKSGRIAAIRYAINTPGISYGVKPAGFSPAVKEDPLYTDNDVWDACSHFLWVVHWREVWNKSKCTDANAVREIDEHVTHLENLDLDLLINAIAQARFSSQSSSAIGQTLNPYDSYDKLLDFAVRINSFRAAILTPEQGALLVDPITRTPQEESSKEVQ